MSMLWQEQKIEEQTASLKSLRRKHHDQLLKGHVASKIINIVQDSDPLADDEFVIVRKSKVLDISDVELQANPHLAELVDIYYASISEHTVALQVQRLKPVNDLSDFNPDDGRLSLGFTVNQGANVFRFPIDGLELSAFEAVDTMTKELELARATGRISLSDDTLVLLPPGEFIQQGIPLL